MVVEHRRGERAAAVLLPRSGLVVLLAGDYVGAAARGGSVSPDGPNAARAFLRLMTAAERRRERVFLAVVRVVAGLATAVVGI